MYDLKEYGGRIRTLRKKTDKTQAEFADMLNVSMETISNIERGERGMSIDLLCDIAMKCNVSTDYILLGKETKEIRGISKGNKNTKRSGCYLH